MQRDENDFASDDGVYIAEALIKKFHKITSKTVRKEIANLTVEPVVWRVTRAAFAKGNGNVLKFLREAQY